MQFFMQNTAGILNQQEMRNKTRKKHLFSSLTHPQKTTLLQLSKKAQAKSSASICMVHIKKQECDQLPSSLWSMHSSWDFCRVTIQFLKTCYHVNDSVTHRHFEFTGVTRSSQWSSMIWVYFLHSEQQTGRSHPPGLTDPLSRVLLRPQVICGRKRKKRLLLSCSVMLKTENDLRVLRKT